MKQEVFNKYKTILDKYKFPYSNNEEIFEIINNTKQLADVILSFEQRRNGLKNYDKPRTNNSKL